MSASALGRDSREEPTCVRAQPATVRRWPTSHHHMYVPRVPDRRFPGQERRGVVEGVDTAPSEQACTCERVRTESGEDRPAAWIGTQGRVALVTKDGQRVEGRPLWVHTLRLDGDGVAEVEIEQDDGADLPVPLSDVSTISAIPTRTPVDIIQAVVQAINTPQGAPADEPLEYHLPVDDHQQLEITVRRVAIPCAPDLRPPRAIFGLTLADTSETAPQTLREDQP